MQSLGKQILYSIVFSAVLMLIVAGLQQLPAADKLIHPGIWTIMIFSAVLGLIVVWVGDWGMRNMDAQSRPNLFIGLTVLRLILSMGFIAIIIFSGLEKRVMWVADFFVVYFCYLAFEVFNILAILRAISREGEKP